MTLTLEQQLQAQQEEIERLKTEHNAQFHAASQLAEAVVRLTDERDTLRASLQSAQETLQWQEITAERLPRSGDQVYRHNEKTGSIIKYGEDEVFNVEALCDFPALEINDYQQWGWTHFRPINPPSTEKLETT